MSTPSVGIVSGTFYRRATCVVCNATAERERTFTASTYEEVRRKGEDWGKRPLAHKKCEPLYLGEESL